MFAREDQTVKHLPASILDSTATNIGRTQEPAGSERRTRWIVGCGVVLFHIAILVILVRVSPQWSPPEIASPLVMLNLSAASAVSKLTTRPATQQRSKSLISGSGERLRQTNPTEGRDSGEFDQTPQSVSTEPLIDWSGELERIAKAEAPELLAERRRQCHDAEMQGKSLIGCGMLKTPDIWAPHRGLAGLLAVGKRVANGHIFDTMRDPDRNRSSVPDILALQEGPRRPAPLAFDPRRDYFIH
jgi:hypothetical protein